MVSVLKQHFILRALAVFAVAICFCSTASAWEEIAVRAHHARINIEKDGSAEVRHELTLKIRGGPVKRLQVPGVGEVTQLLSDGQVSRARLGSAGIWPLDLSLDEAGTLTLQVLGERGLRGGSYRFQFSYLIDLKKRGWLKLQKQGALLTWVAPRFASGIYSAKATFSLPHSILPPQLEEHEDGQLAGVLLSEIRRGSSRDEIELVRAYVAAQEPALFQIRAPQDLFIAPETTVEVSKILPASLKEQLSNSKVQSTWFIALLFGFFMGIFAWRKSIEVQRAAQLAQARPRPLIPAPGIFRGLIVLSFAALSAFYFLDYQPERGVLCALPSLLLSTYLMATRVAQARGPGSWCAVVDVHESVPLATDSQGGRKFEATERLAIFDVSSVTGAFFLLFLTIASALSAWLLLHQSHYYALGVLGALCFVLPLFFTGQKSQLPKSPRQQAEPYFHLLREQLNSLPMSFELWGRQGLAIEGEDSRWVAGGRYDEMRIRIILDSAASGLRAFEISLDEMSGNWVRPCIVLKVLDDSDALAQLPDSIVWRRGSRADEKVALIALRSADQSELFRLLRGLSKSLKRQKNQRSQRANNEAKSPNPARSEAKSAWT